MERLSITTLAVLASLSRPATEQWLEYPGIKPAVLRHRAPDRGPMHVAVRCMCRANDEPPAEHGSRRAAIVHAVYLAMAYERLGLTGEVSSLDKKLV